MENAEPQQRAPPHVQRTTLDEGDSDGDAVAVTDDELDSEDVGDTDAVLVPDTLLVAVSLTELVTLTLLVGDCRESVE